MEQKTKFAYQDLLYHFPYHYLPSLEDGLTPRLHRQLSWGLEYLTYMSFVAEYIKQQRIESLCDVGCGDGRLINMVKEFVPHVTGIDLSERATAFAKAFNPEVEILCDDISNLKHQYQMVTLVEVLEHISDQQTEDFLRNVSRLLSPDGCLLVTVPTVNVPLNKKHYRHYDLQVLEKSLSPHFEIKRHWWLYRQGRTEKLLRKLLCNKFYLLNYPPALRLIWRTHQRISFYADNQTGTHLVCLAYLL